MKLSLFNDPVLFRKKTEAFLLDREAENNLPLGLIYQLENNEAYENPLMGCIETVQKIELVFVMTPPHFLVFSAFTFTEDLIEFTVDALSKLNISIPGIVGEKLTMKHLAEKWTAKHHLRSFTVMEQLIYQLDQVKEIPISEGRLNLATVNHTDLVAQWIKDFSEATPEATLTLEQSRKKAELFIEQRTIYLWMIDDTPVSMCRKARPSKNGIVINLVYTPEKYRKQGFASSCVAILSKQLLKEYSFCSLYTDLANPTSNHIYQEIGYKPVMDSIMIGFEKE